MLSRMQKHFMRFYGFYIPDYGRKMIKYLLRVNQIERTTDKAIAIKDLNDETIWLPKSQIDIEERKNEIHITLPKWLADKYSLEVEEI